MAPEQLEGQEADARTDLWGFGAVLHEMVTGRRAFDGESEAHIIGAIVERDPEPLTTRQPTIPPELDRLVRTCLAKKPDDRWATCARRRRTTPWDRRPRTRRPRGIGTSIATCDENLLAAVATVAALAIGATALLLRRAAPAETTAGGKPSIGVLYFENNTGNASLDWLRTGLTDMVVTDLSQSPDVEVLGTDRLYQILRDLHRADDRVVAFGTVQELARRAGVKTFVVGSYVKAGDAIPNQHSGAGSSERPDPRRRAGRGRQRSADICRCRRSHTADSSEVCAAFELGIGVEGAWPGGRPSAGSGIDRDSRGGDDVLNRGVSVLRGRCRPARARS